MVKVMHIINGLTAGGAERFMADIVTRLDPRILQIRVVCIFSLGVFAPQLVQAGIPVKLLGLDRVRNLDSFIRVWREVRDFEPDIVHNHLPAACWLGLTIAWIAGVPVRISHLQNQQPLWPRPTRLLDGLISRFANATLACSEGVRRHFVDQNGYSAQKMSVVYNAVDLNRFRALPDRLGIRKTLDVHRDTLVMTCVGSLSKEQKGHRFLLEAMRHVRTELPNVLLLLVGDGAHRTQLEQQVEKLHLKPVVRFLGIRQDVPAILSASDLFVLPSLWEGLPLALIEAGAVGLASVATTIEGVCEVVQDGRTGFLVEPGKASALAGALVELLRDTERRLVMGIKARALIEQRFDVQRITMDVQSLYLRLFRETAIHRRSKET
jgi:glycosyltransferase involved in cell wall biosynthesis